VVRVWLALAVAFGAVYTTATWSHFMATHGLRLQEYPPSPELAQARLVAMMALLALTVSCVQVYRLAGAHDLRRIFVHAIGLHVCMLFALPILSTDLFTYLAYGALATRGFNVHAVGPAALGDSPLVALANWPNTPSVYGPMADLINRVAGQVGAWCHSPVWAAGAAYKTILGAADLASIWAIQSIAKTRDTRGATAGFALFALNPLVASEIAGQGHNDGLVVCGAALYILAAWSGRNSAALLALAGGAYAKLALAPALLLHGCWVFKDNWRRGVRAALPAAALGAALYGPMLGGGGAFAALAVAFNRQRASESGFALYMLFWKLFRHVDGSETSNIVTYALFTWIGRLLLLLAFLAAVRHARNAVDVIHWNLVILLAVLGTATTMAPWYFTWLLPFVAVDAEESLHILAMVITFPAALVLAGPHFQTILNPAAQVVALFWVVRTLYRAGVATGVRRPAVAVAEPHEGSATAPPELLDG